MSEREIGQDGIPKERRRYGEAREQKLLDGSLAEHVFIREEVLARLEGWMAEAQASEDEGILTGTAASCITWAQAQAMKENGALVTFHGTAEDQVGRVFPPASNLSSDLGMTAEGLIEKSGRIDHARIVRLPGLSFGAWLKPDHEDYEKRLADPKLGLGFGRPEGPMMTNAMVIVTAKDGEWAKPVAIPAMELSLHPNAQVLHYASTEFEGMTCEQGDDGKLYVFNLEDHYGRYVEGASELNMPAVSFDMFKEAVLNAVRANLDFVPPDRKGRLYLRPVQFDMGPRIGVDNSRYTTFLILTTPIGNESAYFGNLTQPVIFGVPVDRTRSGPGTGQIKFGGNYAPTTLQVRITKELGFKGLVFPGRSLQGDYTPEAANKQSLRETHASNILFFEHLGDDRWRIVTPTLETKDILPGMNRALIIKLARDLGWEVEEREVTFGEAISGKFEFAAACGTAAFITPIHGFHSYETVPQEKAEDMPAEAPLAVRRRRVGRALGQLHMLPFAANRKTEKDFRGENEWKPEELMPEPIQILIKAMVNAKRANNPKYKASLTEVEVDSEAATG